MLAMLVAYDADGNAIATLDHLVRGGGLVDFDDYERNGGEMTDVWTVPGAKGSKAWPEFLGAQIHDFRVELDGPEGNKRISALVHKRSGARRDRSEIDDAIRQRIQEAEGKPADLRDIVGGPDRPIRLDQNGRRA